MKSCGLIINPIAGMGGSVGLKGTDGQQILKRAIEMGATPRSEERARCCLMVLSKIKDEIELVTPRGSMGEDLALECGFKPTVIGEIARGMTSAEDTIRTARLMKTSGVDIILFAGGDGTARDIYTAVGRSITVLGIPAGVKIQSAVFARNPVQAGEIAMLYLKGRITTHVEAEVMDLCEQDYRRGILNGELFGYLKIPHERNRLQRLKEGSSKEEIYEQEAIAHHVIEGMSDDIIYVIGPGSTTSMIQKKLNIDFSLIGVDIIGQRTLIERDVCEADLIKRIEGRSAKLIITPIGGQGFILGRGNQQISPYVVRKIGKENIIIISTIQKINRLHARPLLVDTGDSDLDEYLSGYYRIVTGYHREIIYRVAS